MGQHRYILLAFILMLEFVHVESKFCDYLMVRQNDESDRIGLPTCPHAGGDSRVVFFEGVVVNSINRCLSLACEANATVVYFEQRKKCIGFNCESNNKNKNWAFKWAQAPETKKRHRGQTYALPHPYVPRCYNSYFVKRSWSRDNGLKSKCFQITTSTIHEDELKTCMKKACVDKANALNFYKLRPNFAQCETMHCSWNSGSGDLDLKIGEVRDEHANTTFHTYSLSHSTSLSSCQSAFWNDSVQMTVKISQCAKWGMFPDTLVKDDHNPSSICQSGCNTFQSHPGSSMITASMCEVNAEGTDWKYHEDQIYDKDTCFADEEPTKWLSVPYPGTPTCNSTNSIFRLRYLREQCKKSTCDIGEKVHNVRDLRQCMIYACELNYNVINYFGNTSFVICDLRNCSMNGSDYDFELIPRSPRGYDIYELHESKQYQSKSDMSESKFYEQMKDAIDEIATSNKNLVILQCIHTVVIAIAIVAAVIIHVRVRQGLTRVDNGQKYNKVTE